MFAISFARFFRLNAIGVASLTLTLAVFGSVYAAEQLRAWPNGFKPDKSPTPQAGLVVGTYTGWTNSILMQATNQRVDVVIVPAVGGRIMNFSLNGENILYERPESAGKTLENSKVSFSVGGYQCDIGPEIRGIPNHNQLWMGRHEWTNASDYQVNVLSGVDPDLGVEISKQIRLDPPSGMLEIEQRLENKSDQETAYCLWDRTLCQGGGFAFFPLNKKSRFIAGWSMRRTIDGKYVYDGDNPVDERVKSFDGVLVVKAGGPALKVGADSNAGWIAYARGRLLFVKYFPSVPWGIMPDLEYSDGGNTIEFYCDDRVAELEPLSSERKLRKGAMTSYTFTETWRLFRLEESVTTYEQARALVDKVKAFQFLSRPTVHITIKTEEHFYFIGGEVKNPQRRVFTEGITVLKAIEGAGGLTDFGNRKRIQIIRANGEKLTINHLEILKDPKLDVPIGPGDTITVPRRLF